MTAGQFVAGDLRVQQLSMMVACDCALLGRLERAWQKMRERSDTPKKAVVKMASLRLRNQRIRSIAAALSFALVQHANQAIALVGTATPLAT